MKYKVDKQGLIELKEMGYVVHEFKPWHFRVYKNRENRSERYIDLFPTTHVYCYYENGEYLGKGTYEDMLKIVETKIDTFI